MKPPGTRMSTPALCCGEGGGFSSRFSAALFDRPSGVFEEYPPFRPVAGECRRPFELGARLGEHIRESP